MKILHAAETVKGGVATVMRTLALAQAGQGAVRALVPQESVREMAPFRNLRTFRRETRSLAELARFCGNFIAEVTTFRPNVVHLHGPMAGALGRMLLVLMWPLVRPQVVYSPHVWTFIAEGSPRKKRWAAELETWLYPLASTIICASHYEAEEARRIGLPGSKIKVVPNGTPQITATDIPNPYNPQAFNLLFVGRPDFQKGFDVLLDAMERLQNAENGQHIHLTVAGDIPDKKHRPKRPNITYLGWQSAEKLVPFFAHAGAVVVPSRWEGFAMVPVEAMSYGVPVIASRVCSLPEVVTEGVTGKLFTAANSTELAELLLTTPQQNWSEMGQNALKKHTESLTVNHMADATARLYLTSKK